MIRRAANLRYALLQTRAAIFKLLIPDLPGGEYPGHADPLTCPGVLSRARKPLKTSIEVYKLDKVTRENASSRIGYNLQR
jgi:hypothetical protein